MPMDEKNIFQLIAQASQKTGARLLLIGGFAVNAYNYARNTRDVDFLVSDDDYRKISVVLASSGYEESVRTQVFAKQVSKGVGAMPVDFLFVDESTFELIWRAGREATLSGRRFRLPSLIHLIALKLHAIKQGSKDRAWKDIPDIMNLIRANKLDTSSADFKMVCQKFGPEGIYQEILKMNSAKGDGK